jgi:pimeloyl-ACP methyl ester carboxylesterase
MNTKLNLTKPTSVFLLGLGLLLPIKPNLWAQPVPHHFSDITAQSDHTIALSLEGSVSNLIPGLSGTISNQFMQMFDLYVVEASTNLVDWTRLPLLLRTNNNPTPLLFQDTNAAGFRQRFYRTLTNHLITGFPKPTGPFPVGIADRILTDPSRSNRYGIKTNSSFMSTFWYPAELPRPGSVPGAYNERAVAGDRNFYSFWGWSSQWTNVVPQFVAYSLPEVPSASGQDRFPLILFSHGWTCDRRLNFQTAEELASHGYIVAAVDHEDCHATVFPDARGTRYVPPGTVGYDSASVRSRTNDIQCLLRELGQMDSRDPLLAGRLDLDRIGMMGMSFGGGTAAETGRLDSRVKCVALLDAYIDFANYSVLNSQGLQKPFLAMNRTILDHSDKLIDFSPASQRLYTLATTDATWLKITKAGHFSFSDCAWAVEMTSYSRQGAVAIDTCLRWFFDTYLKGETPPFPTNPEIANVQRK